MILPRPSLRRIRQPIAAAAVLLVALCANGCTGSTAGARHYTQITFPAYADGVTTRSITYATAATTLRVTVSISQFDYPVGTPIPMTLTITNTGAGNCMYDLCGFDLAATASALPPISGEVWSSTFGEATPGACQKGLALAPGASVTSQITWNQNENYGTVPLQETYLLKFVSGRLPQNDPTLVLPTLYVTIGTPLP